MYPCCYCSVAELCPTLCDPIDDGTWAFLPSTISQSLLKLLTINSVMPSNHLILCHPLLLLPSIFPSIKVFPNESILCIRWPKYWSFSFSNSPSSEYSGLISFKIGWFDLAVQAHPAPQFESITSLVLSLTNKTHSFCVCVCVCVLIFLLIPRDFLCTQSDHIQTATILFLSFQAACLYFFPLLSRTA